jgi:peptidoglycan/xylan/chitin deacetylase (PgdA/CDA1 family)
MKRAAERTLVAAGVPRLLQRRVRGTTLVLAYHNVVADGSAAGGDGSLHLPLTVFREQLELLVETHDVIPLDEVFRMHRGSRPRAVITFDDAYRGAVTVGVPELAVRGLPATIFVAPAFVPDGSFWWDAASGPEWSLPEGVRDRMLAEFAGRDSVIRAHLSAQGVQLREVPGGCRVANETELVRALSSHSGLSLGSHSWSHPNLTGLDDAELRMELATSIGWLRERFSRVVPWLAYPYGLGSTRVGAAAAAAGYEGAVQVGGGRIRGTMGDPYAVPRLNVPASLSRNGFALRIGGVVSR